MRYSGNVMLSSISGGNSTSSFPFRYEAGAQLLVQGIFDPYLPGVTHEYVSTIFEFSFRTAGGSLKASQTVEVPASEIYFPTYQSGVYNARTNSNLLSCANALGDYIHVNIYGKLRHLETNVLSYTSSVSTNFSSPVVSPCPNMLHVEKDQDTIKVCTWGNIAIQYAEVELRRAADDSLYGTTSSAQFGEAPGDAYYMEFQDIPAGSYKVRSRAKDWGNNWTAWSSYTNVSIP